jgi:predicted nucleic acid-binding protein
VLQDFGSVRELALLKRLKPVVVTDIVVNEQRRTAPPHSQEQFNDALKAGWITIHTPASRRAVEERMDQYFGLSRADAELLVICEREQQILFTDDKALRKAAKEHDVETYNVPEMVGILLKIGELDQARTEGLVRRMHVEHVRHFGQRELAALGMTGIF